MVQPLFIFSLPRSGSTLLQRLLMSHDKISSVSEPWLLLPLLHMLKRGGCYAEYNHYGASVAIKDFVSNLPRGKDDYLEGLRNFATLLYEKVSPPGTEYFIDKTPRYYLIIPEIVALFPNAKFIFLFRNPLDVYASIANTFGKGTLRIHNYHLDLYKGPQLLAEGYNNCGGRSIRVQYEELVKDVDGQIHDICNYLGIKTQKRENIDLRDSNAKLIGRMGDRVGTKKYRTVTDKSVGRWAATFNTTFRKRLVKFYLNYLGKDTLNTFGFDMEELLFESKQLAGGCKGLAMDLFYHYFGGLYRVVGGREAVRRIQKGLTACDGFHIYG